MAAIPFPIQLDTANPDLSFLLNPFGTANDGGAEMFGDAVVYRTAMLCSVKDGASNPKLEQLWLEAKADIESNARVRQVQASRRVTSRRRE